MRRFVECEGTWSGYVVRWQMGDETFTVNTVNGIRGTASVIVVIAGDTENPTEPIGIAVVCQGRTVELRCVMETES